MAGKIIADTIEASGSQISLNVGNVTILTASSTGLTLTPTNNVNINVTNSNVTFTTANVTGVATFSAGSNTAPSITTSGDTNTGLYFPTADTIGFVEGGVEAMRIDSSGNVGIGTSSPSARLQVNGTTDATQRIIVNGTGNVSSIKLQYNGTEVVQLQNYQGSEVQFGTTNSAFLALVTNNTERMRISGADLFIGRTSTFSYANGKVCINADGIGNPGLVVGVSLTTSYNNIVLGNGNGNVGSIVTNGSSTAFNTSSDYRLKENIAPMMGALNKVAQLKPVTYKWKVDGTDGEGFIAHELAEVCPHAVSGEKDAIDNNGHIKPQGIDVSFLVATLTAAIQELKIIVDAQAVEIAALKAK